MCPYTCAILPEKKGVISFFNKKLLYPKVMNAIYTKATILPIYGENPYTRVKPYSEHVHVHVPELANLTTSVHFWSIIKVSRGI